MRNSRLWVSLAVFVTFVRSAERGDTCATPNKKNGSCVSLRACPYIYDLLEARTNDSNFIEFARRSQCGFDSEPLVCCGFDTPISTIEVSTTALPLHELILENFEIKGLSDTSVCGIQVSDRIRGGITTSFGELPWVAALEYESKLTGENGGIRCGGSIINKRYILTAAHCIIHREFKVINVRVGEWDTSTNPDCYPGLLAVCADPVQNIKIEKIIPHEYYSKKTKNNDIGLLRLEKDINYSEFIRPICLPSPYLPIPQNGTLMTVSGWGLTENSTLSTVKLKVTVPVISHNVCLERLKSKYDSRTVTSTQLCVGGEEGKDSCEGDSGGPLMRAYNNKITGQTQWYQEGLVSWGTGCGLRGRPGVYTRVSRYVVWITNNISEK